MANKGGYSREGLFGTIHHYDAKGHKIGESRPGFFGGYNNYDAKGHKVGESNQDGFGGFYNNDRTTEGCYIATCVYDPYDCPEVWTLLEMFALYRWMQ